MEEHFYFTERLGHNITDNDITYDAGPVNISICGVSKKITIDFGGKQWLWLYPDFALTIKQAWEITDDDIVQVSDTKFEIKTTYEILNRYLEYNIIYSSK